jgi:hypothetical protein
MINLQKYLPLGLSLSVNKFRSILLSIVLSGAVALIFSLLKLIFPPLLLWLYLLALITAIFLLGITIHIYDILNRKERELKQSVEDFNYVNKRLHDFYPEFNMRHEKEFNKAFDEAIKEDK